MKRDHFLKLLSQKHASAISKEEEAQLKHAIDSNPEYKAIASLLFSSPKKEKVTIAAHRSLEKIWGKIAEAEKNPDSYGDSGSQFSVSNSQFSVFNFQFSVYTKVAALIVLLLGFSIISYQLLKRNQTSNAITVATLNQEAFKVLDDGTKIWLNKQSTLTFNKDFGKEKREVFLTGEAYFDVVKNKAVPLFIHAGNIKIEVKGTAFNVNAYKNQPNIQVSLIRGAIEITEKTNKIPMVRLNPNEKFIFQNEPDSHGNTNYLVIPMFASANQDILTTIKWVSDTLTFKKEKLKDLVLKMETKYGMTIEVQSERLKEKRFSGTFINETIQQALEALKLSYPLTYTIRNKMVVIKD